VKLMLDSQEKFGGGAPLQWACAYPRGGKGWPTAVGGASRKACPTARSEESNLDGAFNLPV